MTSVGHTGACVCCESCACAAAVHSVVFFAKLNESQGVHSIPMFTGCEIVI